MKRVMAVGILALSLAGCSVEPPYENDSRFADVNINGTRCIVYQPGDTSIGIAMQCDFGYVSQEQVPVTLPVGPPIDIPELSPPPPEVVPAEPIPTEIPTP